MGPTAPKRTRAAMLMTALFAAAIAALLALGSVSDASAQVDCAEWQFGWEVSTAQDFNDAVACHNQGWPATTNIILLSDISATGLADDAVFATIRGGDLVIVGQGYSLRRDGSAPSTPAPVLAIETIDANDIVGVLSLGVVVGPADTAGIAHAGPGRLDLTVTSITGDLAAASAIGLQTDAPSAVRYSMIAGLPTGLEATNTSLLVEQSTIAATSTDLDLTGTNDVDIRNATLAAPVGISFDQGTTVVSNTTVVGDAASPKPTPGSSGRVSFISSIVNTCSAQEILPIVDSGPGWADDGYNAGGCFSHSAPVLLTLADNGCDRRTPVGCPTTAAIDDISAAANVGLCGSPLPEYDQRGAARTPLGTGCDAGAYEASCSADGNIDVEVFDADEFSAALLCHNLRPGSTTGITLGADISARRLAESGTVFPLMNAGTVIIDGQGNSIRRAIDAPNDEMPLLAAGDSVRLFMQDIALLVGPNDSYGLRHDGSGRADIRSLAVAPWDEATTATGVYLSADVDHFVMSDSTISGMPVGMHLDSSVNVIARSTIASADTDVVWNADGVGGIFNSTLAGPTGIELGPGGLHVENSTILGDGAALSPAAGPNTFVAFRSSIITDCTADRFVTETEPGPGWADLGNNVGACVDPALAAQLQLEQYDCATPTPLGCARVAPIDVSSVAFGAGNCAEGNLGPRDVDQRGAPRSPLGTGCDAGAFEVEPCDTLTGRSFSVGSQASLNEAIACFNDGTNGAGQYNVTLTTDILVNDLRVGRSSSFVSIDQRAVGFELIVDGAGNRITAPDALQPSSVFAASDLFSTAATNIAPVEIANVAIGAPTASTSTRTYIRHESSASLTVRNSALFDEINLDIDAIRSTGGGPIGIYDSWFVANTGLVVQDQPADVTIERSAFTPLGASSAASRVTINAGTVVIENSTFDNAPLTLGPTVTGSIRNTTLRGDPAQQGEAAVAITSSLLNTCGPNVVDGGSNVGGCFGDPVDLSDPVDAVLDVCFGITPNGCPPVVELALTSPARGAGDCSGVPVDQRSSPRTPIGPGCDAGAFEAHERGDVTFDGQVTNADVQALLEWLAGGTEPQALFLGDVNGDGNVKLDDALAIAQIVASG